MKRFYLVSMVLKLECDSFQGPYQQKNVIWCFHMHVIVLYLKFCLYGIRALPFGKGVCLCVVLLVWLPVLVPTLPLTIGVMDTAMVITVLVLRDC